MDFCFYCGKLTHESRFCEDAKDTCVGFGCKYASYDDWLQIGINFSIPSHVKWGIPDKKILDVVGNVVSAFNSMLQNLRVLSKVLIQVAGRKAVLKCMLKVLIHTFVTLSSYWYGLRTRIEIHEIRSNLMLFLGSLVVERRPHSRLY